jgi:DNA-binding winged helix-turn-helix (wHTH) protein
VVPSAALDALQVAGFRLDLDRKQVSTPEGAIVKLTNLESRLLYLLMGHPGWVMETDYLIDRVWGHFGEGDSALLKNVVYRLRRKIEPDPGQPRYLLTESSLGYKFQAAGNEPGSTDSAQEGAFTESKTPPFVMADEPGPPRSGNAREKTRPRPGNTAAVLTEYRMRETGQLHEGFLLSRK